MYEPTKQDKFAFGLWTVGNVGADPFGGPVREKLSPMQLVSKLGELGVWGVALHDNDLVPFDKWTTERDKIVAEFKKALAGSGVVTSMVTCSLFGHPVFRDGALTSPDPQVRRFAAHKVLHALDLCAELGAKIFVCWGGREGSECDAGKSPIEALKRYREGFNYASHYVKDQGYDIRFAIEAKPNEPRGDIYLPTTGAVLGFIETLDHPDMFGVNPETAHENMAGLNFYHAVAQAVEVNKLWHIDLNAQKLCRYDQDMRFGSEDIKGAFYLVKLLEDIKFAGPKHFDSHAYRSEDYDGVWEFAKGSMRTYKILQEKAAQFNADKEIQALVKKTEPNPKYSKEDAQKLKAQKFDADALAKKGAGYEKLDMLVTELLLGVRGR